MSLSPTDKGTDEAPLSLTSGVFARRVQGALGRAAGVGALKALAAQEPENVEARTRLLATQALAPGAAPSAPKM